MREFGSSAGRALPVERCQDMVWDQRAQGLAQRPDGRCQVADIAQANIATGRRKARPQCVGAGLHVNDGDMAEEGAGLRLEIAASARGGDGGDASLQ